MVPTLFGVGVLLIAMALALRPVNNFLVFTMFTGLLGGASAIDLPALGGSSIPPATFAFALFACRVLCSRTGGPQRLLYGARLNIELVAFCLYGIVSAFLMPWIFDGTFKVVPLRPGPYGQTVPLHFSNQNVTTAAYIFCGLWSAPIGAVIGRWQNRSMPIVHAFVVIAWLFVLSGLADEVLSFAGHGDWLNFFRNGHYAQLNQRVDGLKRLAGTFPEASAFAAFGFGLFVFLTEFWLRNIRSGLTGPAALAVLAIVLLSTSSTGYVSVAAYAALLAFRLSFFPSRLHPKKVEVLVICAVLLASGALVLVLTNEGAWRKMTGILSAMTLNKLSSSSGVERMSWATRGLNVFWQTFGFGAGVGSFRSSSMLVAIIGSVGVPGTYLFVSYIWKALRPGRVSSYDLRLRGDDAIASAFIWGAVASLFPAIIGGSSPDPGTGLGLFCGYAMAIRHVQSAKRKEVKAAEQMAASQLHRDARHGV